MRQVPTQTHYAIIGNGRVARHFSHYLSLLEIPYKQWSRSDKIPLAPVVASCNTVFLLINDSVIETFIEEQPCLENVCCVHFSGSLVTDLAHGAHPLMTFGSDLYSLETYQSIPWVLDASAPAFDVLFPGLSNPSFSIDGDKKAYYHALCVMSNNFTTLLWSKFFDSIAKVINIPKEYLIPYCEQTMKNIVKDHHAALTGPLVRDDQITLNNNLNALENDAFEIVYRAFIKAYQEENKR